MAYMCKKKEPGTWCFGLAWWDVKSIAEHTCQPPKQQKILCLTEVLSCGDGLRSEKIGEYPARREKFMIIGDLYLMVCEKLGVAPDKKALKKLHEEVKD